MSFIPPQNFGMVECDLYRSGAPTELNFPFLEKLQLRKIIYLAPDECSEMFLNWLAEQQIELIQLGDDAGHRSPWKPVSEDVVVQGLHLLLDPQNYPLLVMCNLGRHRTGTMIGCLRKLQGWNLTSILEEYRRHAGSKFRLLNEQFIELFDCDLVPTSGRWRAPAAMPFEPMASGPAAAPMPAAVPPSPTAVPPSPTAASPGPDSIGAASPGPDAEKRLG